MLVWIVKFRLKQGINSLEIVRFDNLAKLKDTFSSLSDSLLAIVDATKGNEDAKKRVEAVFEQLIVGNWQIVNAIKSIWAGERNVEKLTENIDRNSALIIHGILQALNDDNEPSTVVNNQLQPPQEQGVTLPQLFELVERAVGGDQQLGGQLFTAFQQMAKADHPAMSVLGKVLLRVLVGEPNPILDGLPDEVASAVWGLLGRLKH